MSLLDVAHAFAAARRLPRAASHRRRVQPGPSDDVP